MKKTSVISLAALLAGCIAMAGAPAMANPGNGNGNGHSNGGGHGNGNGNGNHGNSGKQNAAHGKNYGKPDQVAADIPRSRARQLAVNYGLTGYASLPPGIAKNLARGKPLPPGIAKKAVPADMLRDLPYYPGHEWSVVGDNLVLIALSTALVTAVITGVFD